MFTPNYNLSISYIKKMQLIKVLNLWKINIKRVNYIEKMQLIKAYSYRYK